MGLSLPRLLQETFEDWSNDQVPRLSAALACYTVFSISPLLILVLNIAGTFFGGDAVRGELELHLQSLMGAKAAGVVQDMVRSTLQPRQSMFTAITGIATLLIGATGLFAEMQSALNVIWDTPVSKKHSSLMLWARTRLMGLVGVLTILALLVVSLLATGVFAFLANHMPANYMLPPAFWVVMGFCVSFLGEVALFTIIFKVLPAADCPWRYIWGGALLTAILFEAGKWGLGWYLGRESTLSLYGAAGSLVLLLLWVYYSAMIILTGAEITHVYSRLYTTPQTV